MAEEDLKIRKARSVYRKLCEAVEKNGWKCKSDDDKLAVAYGIKVENGGEFQFLVSIDADRQLVCLNSFTLMEFDAAHIIEGAVAVCGANFLLADGNFDLKIKGGALSYRQALAFHNSTNLAVDAIDYLLTYSLYAVNSFIGKFELVKEGKLKGGEFIEACKDIL